MPVAVIDDPARLSKRTVRSVLAGKGWLISAFILLVVGAMVVLGSRIAPYDPFEQVPEERFIRPWNGGPTGWYAFGTDELGRDVLSRTIQAARLTLFIAFAAISK